MLVKPRRLVLSVLVVAALAGACVVLAQLLLMDPVPNRGPSGSVPVGILGDSDSHSYQDRVWFAPDGPMRGGKFRAHTFQWTEALARMRAGEVNLGEWGRWGTGGVIARLRLLAGRSFRSIRKEDYQFNFAVSGAQCGDLTGKPFGQVWGLLSLMDLDPAYWKRGLIVIRIGVNDFGQTESLDQLAADKNSAIVRARISECVRTISASLGAIRARHPETAVVLVGIFNNTNWPRNASRWQSSDAMSNIERGLDQFDAALRRLASDSKRVVFFDDRAWFDGIWGARGEDGSPGHRTIRIGESLTVSNSEGDSPDNSVTGDGHAGLVWNALWAKALTDLVQASLDIGISPITEAEIETWIGTHLITTAR